MVPPAADSGKKRKQDANPFDAAAATKKLKKEKSNKRRGEEVPGGLVIVRGPSLRLPSSQPSSRPDDTATAPTTTTTRQHSSKAAASVSIHPSKKLRTYPSGEEEQDERALDDAVRQMDDEAASLRRSHPPSAEDARLAREHGLDLPPPAMALSKTSSSNGKQHKKSAMSSSKTTGSHYHDEVQAMPQHDTPRIERNRALRDESTAMHEQMERGRQEAKQQHQHRRRSSLSRGKRASTSLVAGVILQPHTSVHHTSFYNYIDSDLPDFARMRQLLTWCTARTNPPSSSHTTSNSGKDPPVASSSTSAPPPPPLSAAAEAIFSRAIDDTARALAEGLISTSGETQGAAAGPSTAVAMTMKPNPQNVANRAREVEFGAYIDKMHAEEQAWKRTEEFYNTYATQIKADMERQQALVKSAKAKGKEKEREELWHVREDELPEEFQGRKGVLLARRVLAERTGDEELQQRLADLPFKVDQLHSIVYSALHTTHTAELELNQRFAQLSAALTSRISPFALPSSTAAASPLSSSSLLSSSPSFISSSSLGGPQDPQRLLRAITRVDAARPPGQIGHAARSAAREVKRVGAQGVQDRRLTGVMMQHHHAKFGTPRKMPATPRRGSTPGRDR